MGERGEQWGGHSAYITGTLGPFVLSDPGLLSRFQTGINTNCGGNVQGDTVTGPVCVCVVLLIRGYIYYNHSPLAQ